MKLSIILTSWDEPKTVAKAIECIVDKEYSGIIDDFEFIQVSPDESTLANGAEAALKYHLGSKFIQIKDVQKGKPHALNMAFKKVNGEIIILTDGEVFFDRNAVKLLYEKILSDKKIGGVCGRPISTQSDKTFWGYTGKMFLAAADKKRTEASKNSTSFGMSGYIMAIRNLNFVIPDKVFDDIYISYDIINRGYKIAYEPNAKVYIKQPTNLNDWISQKVRNIRGQQDSNLPKIKKSEQRSFIDELKYIFFAITYARTPKEFLWSLLNYPLRLYIWLMVWRTKYIHKKSSVEIWSRIDSTK
jgi:biofilm PGA synthesis N-glycosyltransferase PgaC